MAGARTRLGGTVRGRRLISLLVVVVLPAVLGLPVQGCGRGKPRHQFVSKSLLTLAPGGGYRLVSDFPEAPVVPGLMKGPDGVLRLPPRFNSQPVLPAPVRTVYKKRVSFPAGTVFQAGFGVLPEGWNKTGDGVRFSVRLISKGKTTEVLSREVRRGTPNHGAEWTPQVVKLPAMAGVGELELSVEPLEGAVSGKDEALASGYAVWVNPMLVAPGGRDRPNIVIILVDALRADHLGCYGYSGNTSPFLDRLSQQGVLFEDATSQATFTLPSVVSLFTSSYPMMIGAANAAAFEAGDGASAQASPGTDGQGAAAEAQPVTMPISMQGELQKLGYSTFASVGGGFLDPGLGFCRGFDWYRTQEPGQEIVLSGQLSDLRGQLSAERPEPFFLFLHTYKVHSYFEQAGEGMDPARKAAEEERLTKAVVSGSAETLSQSDLQYLRALYDQEIRETDRELEGFVNWLLGSPWGKNTVVIIIADHGEAFGEHGRTHHAQSPYREVSHVPLLIRTPDGRSKGLRVREPVAFTDLLPTVLELAGGRAPSGVLGRSLVPLLEGGGAGASRAILAESSGPGLMVREGKWAYIARPGVSREELYNLAADPAELDNVAARQPQALARMRQALAEQVMLAARGYRLVLAGPRKEVVTVEIAAQGRFSYLWLPTRSSQPGVEVKRADSSQAQGAPPGGGCTLRATFPPGEATHVMLFEPGGLGDTVTVTAWVGQTPMKSERLHLGPGQRTPGALPVRLRMDEAGSQMLTDKPPVPSGPADWGMWIWLPARALAEKQAMAAAGPAQVTPELRQQLRALGYVR